MNTLKLKPVNITYQILCFLEERQLIRTLRPTLKILQNHSAGGMVDTIYTSASEFGSHKLICIGLSANSTQIELNSHPDNEEFIIINNTFTKFKPLYMAIGLHKHNILEEKAKNKELTSNDIMLLRLKYNNTKTSIFTMLRDTPHCELTTKEEGTQPIFFVSEPSNLTMNYLKLPEYNLALDTNGHLRRKK
ncbi:MAG: hypothetical protein ABIH27_05660 [Candidatus Omnitrophota bacterium]